MICLKKCKFGKRWFYPGDTIPEKAVLPGRKAMLIRQGWIADIEDAKPEKPGIPVQMGEQNIELAADSAEKLLAALLSGDTALIELDVSAMAVYAAIGEQFALPANETEPPTEDGAGLNEPENAAAAKADKVSGAKK